MSAVRDGLLTVRERIERAAARAGRPSDAVTLVAVSKRHPAEAVREAYEAGQRVFGENYVQEMMQKAEALGALPEMRWHFIGHLQRNKAKAVAELGERVAGSVDVVVETVSSSRLAIELDRRAAEVGRRLECFVQVDVAGEAQKSGCAPDELAALLAEVRARPQLVLRGLMTIPPRSEDPERARPWFARLRELAEAHGVRELSMGMSADLEVAVEEGATHVRVGTAIFGARPP